MKDYVKVWLGILCHAWEKNLIFFKCQVYVSSKAFHDRPVGRRPGLNGSAFSRRLLGRGCKYLSANTSSRDCFHGCLATAVDRLAVGRHFKNILSVRGGDKGGPIFLFNSLGFQINMS